MMLWPGVLDIGYVAVAVSGYRQQADIGGPLFPGLHLAGVLQLLNGVAVLDQSKVRFAVLGQNSMAGGIADNRAARARHYTNLSLERCWIGAGEACGEKLVEGNSGDDDGFGRLYADEHLTLGLAVIVVGV